MAKVVENYCVSCPQGCIHCGRSEDVVYYECDGCGVDDEEEKLYSDGDYHFCAACMIRRHLMDFATDMAEDYGEEWVANNYEEIHNE